MTPHQVADIDSPALRNGLSIEILLSNVVFPSKPDNDTVSVLVSYLCVLGAFVLVGVLAARGGANGTGRLLAGLVAGMMIGALTIATFAVVDAAVERKGQPTPGSATHERIPHAHHSGTERCGVPSRPMSNAVPTRPGRWRRLRAAIECAGPARTRPDG